MADVGEHVPLTWSTASHDVTDDRMLSRFTRIQQLQHQHQAVGEALSAIRSLLYVGPASDKCRRCTQRRMPGLHHCS